MEVESVDSIIKRLQKEHGMEEKEQEEQNEKEEEITEPDTYRLTLMDHPMVLTSGQVLVYTNLTTHSSTDP